MNHLIHSIAHEIGHVMTNDAHPGEKITKDKKITKDRNNQKLACVPIQEVGLYNDA
jgi:hypothetical protein